MPMLSARATCASRSLVALSSRSNSAWTACCCASKTSGKVSSPCLERDSAPPGPRAPRRARTGHRDPGPNARQSVEGLLQAEGDILVAAVEAEVRGEEPLLCA